MKRNPALVRLSRDHNRGLILALYVERTLPSADDAQLDRMQREIVEFWQTALLPHFRTECECLLARVVRHLSIDDALVRRTEDDHLRLNAVLTRIRDTNDVGAHRSLLAELAALLRDHIRWEEATLFESAQRILTADEMASTGADIARRIPDVPPPGPAPWTAHLT